MSLERNWLTALFKKKPEKPPEQKPESHPTSMWEDEDQYWDEYWGDHAYRTRYYGKKNKHGTSRFDDGYYDDAYADGYYDDPDEVWEDSDRYYAGTSEEPTDSNSLYSPPKKAVALLHESLRARKKIDLNVATQAIKVSKTIRDFYKTYHHEFDLPHHPHEVETETAFLKKILEMGIIFPSEKNTDDAFECRTRDLKRLMFLAGKIGREQPSFLDQLKTAHPLVQNMGVGHTEILKISEQLYAIEKDIRDNLNIDIDSLSYAERLKLNVEYLIEKFKENDRVGTFIPENLRAANAVGVNKAQEQWLRSRGQNISMPFMSHRNLVLYFREESWHQMDGFLFCLNYLICRWYVEESGFSKIFDKTQVVSRRPGQYPKTLHELGLQMHDYLNVKDYAFKKQSSVGANTIHFTHGTEHGSEFGSLSVLGTATRTDSRKMRNLGMNYVPLPLYYYKENHEAQNDLKLEESEGDFSADLLGTVCVMIQAIRDLETKMIEEASAKKAA